MMNKKLPERQSIRLENFDYSQAGYYFITICTKNRIERFGKIINGCMKLNQAGDIIKKQWYEISNRFPNVNLDTFVVMPDHIHGIIHIPSTSILKAEIHRQDNKITIGYIVGSYKSLSTRDYIKWFELHTTGVKVGQLWQRNYWERVIRDDDELNFIREYIQNNPQSWEIKKRDNNFMRLIFSQDKK